VRDALTVGIAQWLPRPGDPAGNLATALDLTSRAAAKGADLVVLPELWPSGYNPATLADDVAAAAEPLAGDRGARLGACARGLGIWLVAGSVPERADSGIYNTAILYDRTGRLAAWHRKVHLYEALGEHRVFRPGDRLTVLETEELGTVGLAVCFDGDFAETARALRRAGATMVVLPSAYEQEASTWWRTLYPAHALANGQWWVMANQCGANSSGTLLGESQIISPHGQVAAKAAGALDDGQPQPELLVATLNLGKEIEQAERDNGVLWQTRVQVEVANAAELERDP
jgi:predicted amidohydrolase